MANITARQKAFLEDLEVELPPTKASASRMISFIINGNGCGPTARQGRINLLKAIQRKFNGQIIKHREGGHPLMILRAIRVVPKTREEISEARRIIAQHGGTVKPQPFLVDIRHSFGNNWRHSLGYYVLFEDDAQENAPTGPEIQEE